MKNSTAKSVRVGMLAITASRADPADNGKIVRVERAIPVGTACEVDGVPWPADPEIGFVVRTLGTLFDIDGMLAERAVYRGQSLIPLGRSDTTLRAEKHTAVSA